MKTVKEFKKILESLNDNLIIKVSINNELVDITGISIKKSDNTKNLSLYASINPFQENTEDSN